MKGVFESLKKIVVAIIVLVVLLLITSFISVTLVTLCGETKNVVKTTKNAVINTDLLYTIYSYSKRKD